MEVKTVSEVFPSSYPDPCSVIVIVSIVPSDFKVAIAFACFLGSFVGADISISGTSK